MTALADALEEAGGAAAPRARTAHLRGLLVAELRRGARSCAQTRSGYDDARATVALGPQTTGACSPPARGRAALRADPDVAASAPGCSSPPRSARSSSSPSPAPPAGADDLAPARRRLAGGSSSLALRRRRAATPSSPRSPSRSTSRGIDRLRARGRARCPPAACSPTSTLREPIGAGAPARGRRGRRAPRRPARPTSAVEEHEDAVLALLDPAARRSPGPHDDPDPARRVARRILQRLDGMGKWGGYHTEFAHLARGFAGNDRALADAVGEALLDAGLLAEKPSVGQRHVFLNPRRAARHPRLIDAASVASGLEAADRSGIDAIPNAERASTQVADKLLHRQ